ncbi:MAG: hypothetical protein ACTSWY_01240 [Promethearchaeota archaeon]
MGEKVCAYCGRTLKKLDRFCIFCGRPAIAEISKDKKKKESKKEKEDGFLSSLEGDKKEEKKKKGKAVPFESGDLTPIDEDQFEDAEQEDKEESVPFNEDEEFIPEDLKLDDDVRKQLEKKMKLAIINFKKGTLKKKLEEIMEDVNSERYELDIDFAISINVKLDAVKQIQGELQEKEKEVKDSIGLFKFDELNNIIEERREQLTELKRKYKLHKIKHNIFEQLKREYAGEYKKAQKELADLQIQVRIWISKLKTEKNREEIKLKTVEGRRYAKEISKEELEGKKRKLKRTIEEYEQKINVLENFTGK